MATPAWQPGTLYNPGALVRPLTTLPSQPIPPDNADFEDGDQDWDLGPGFSIVTGQGAFTGTWSLKYDLNAPTPQVAVNVLEAEITAGRTITAQCYVQQGASASGQAGGGVFVNFYNAADVLLSEQDGNNVNSGSGGEWKLSKVVATAPPGTAYARIGCFAFRVSGTAPLFLDSFSWDYIGIAAPDGLIFKAVQANAGFSGSSEPVWPTVLGNTVVDNEVTWEAVLTSRLVYEAFPILKSGSSEPSWPLNVGGSVVDNSSIVWEATSRRIEDERCPNSRIVAIAAQKIFVGDRDIIRFCATRNPLDWSTAEDAGFLPFGLQTYGANPVAALGLYRSNLVAFNSVGFQMWQVDPDPVNMALLDAVAVGCVSQDSVQPLANDLVFENPVGIRNIGIAGASTNLQAGNFGEAVDPLTTPKIKLAIAGRSVYVPSLGQYWRVYDTDVVVLTINGTDDLSWSRYVFPEAITDVTIEGSVLLLRTATGKVWELDADALYDDQVNVSFMIQENGDKILLEDGFDIRLEDASA